VSLVSRSIASAAVAGSLLLAACGGGGGGSNSPAGGGGVPPTPFQTATPAVLAMHDNDGHGTNVAGIAAASGNNGFGFTGVSYKAPLQIYKVFPDPPAGCNTTTDPKACDTSASGADEIKAISEAVAHGAKVINLSLGSSGTNSAEQAAVENAIAAGVVVVAASGNGDSSGVAQASLDCPACYPGVIAVGATTIDDSNPSSITERVASYSNYAAGTSWGIVAPGGDPNTSISGGDPDTLHWIENIFTSTPTDKQFQSACKGDFGGSGTADCRILIAGTSQATPHVAGAAALLLSAGASASSIKTLLCNNATHLSDTHSGCGRLNVYRAMAAAVGDSALPAQAAQTYDCSTNGAQQSESRSLQALSMRSTDGTPVRTVRHVSSAVAQSQQLLVVYDRAKAQANRTIALQSLQSQGLSVQNEMDLPNVGKTIRVLSVAAGKNVDDAMRQLRTANGVLSVERDARRYAQSSSPAFTNDPYFDGAAGTNTPPFYEGQTPSGAWTGGQWDMHVICAANAWGYANSNSTGRIVTAAAGGTVPIAIIDTGADLTHPDLSGRVTVTEIIDSGNGTVTP